MRGKDDAAISAARGLAALARSQLVDRIKGSAFHYYQTVLDLGKWETRLLVRVAFETLWSDLPPNNRAAALQAMFERVTGEGATLLLIAFQLVCALENTDAVMRLADAEPDDAALNLLADTLAEDVSEAFEQTVGEGGTGALNRICSVPQLDSTRARYLRLSAKKSLTEKVEQKVQRAKPE